MTSPLDGIRRALTRASRALRLGRTEARAFDRGDDTGTTIEPPGRRTVLDKLIDGESVTMTGGAQEELGYLIGFTDRKMPNLIRQLLLSNVVPRMELDAFWAQTADSRRDMPEEVTMVYWDGLPLAVWCPAGHLKEFSFNPN